MRTILHLVHLILHQHQYFIHQIMEFGNLQQIITMNGVAVKLLLSAPIQNIARNAILKVLAISEILNFCISIIRY